MTLKVIIAGSRVFRDYQLLKRKCDKIFKNVEEDIIIVSGTCWGTDKLGERYAREKGYKIKRFPAPWDDIEGKPDYQIKERKNGSKYWVGAGNYRNGQMAEYADAAIIFSVNGSGGSADMNERAIKEGLKTRFIELWI